MNKLVIIIIIINEDTSLNNSLNNDNIFEKPRYHYKSEKAKNIVNEMVNV